MKAEVVDMNEVDFMADVMELTFDGSARSLICRVLEKDGLKCDNEDQVVDFVQYYKAEKSNPSQPRTNNFECLYELIRWDYVTTAKLRQLSSMVSDKSKAIFDATMKRLELNDPTNKGKSWFKLSLAKPRKYN